MLSSPYKITSPVSNLNNTKQNQYLKMHNNSTGGSGSRGGGRSLSSSKYK